MTCTLPNRRTSLHFWQTLRTEERTFIYSNCHCQPLQATSNAAARIIVRSEFDRYPVTRDDLDVVHPHLPGKMSVYKVSIGKAHLERSTREGFFYRSLDLFNTLCIRHVIG